MESIDKELNEISFKKEETQNKKLEYPVIDHLFSILNTNEPLNYVLAGYFYKVFSHLTNVRVGLIMNYLFFHKN